MERRRFEGIEGHRENRWKRALHLSDTRARRRERDGRPDSVYMLLNGKDRKARRAKRRPQWWIVSIFVRKETEAE